MKTTADMLTDLAKGATDGEITEFLIVYALEDGTVDVSYNAQDLAGLLDSAEQAIHTIRNNTGIARATRH